MFTSIYPNKSDVIDAFRRYLNPQLLMRGDPKVTYYGTTTVVEWPDGTFTDARPCKASKKVKADKFNPTTGFYVCLAKKVYGNDYKRFIERAVQK